MFYLSVLYFGTNNGLVHSKACFPSPHIHSSTFILLQRKKNLFTWLPNQRNSFHFSVYSAFWHRSYSMQKNCKIIIVRDFDSAPLILRYHKEIFNKMIIRTWCYECYSKIFQFFIEFSFFSSRIRTCISLLNFLPLNYNIHVYKFKGWFKEAKNLEKN